MKKSKLVAVGLAGAVAAMISSGCYHRTQTADCVDAQGRVVSDSYCQNTYIGYHNYHWLYGGRIAPFYGGYRRVIGGSSTPMPGANVNSRSGFSISRGGFGGAGDSHASFGGFHGFGG